MPSGRVGNAKDAIFRSNEHFREAVGERESLDVQVSLQTLLQGCNLATYSDALLLVAQPYCLMESVTFSNIGCPRALRHLRFPAVEPSFEPAAGAGAQARQAPGDGRAQQGGRDPAAQVPGAAAAAQVRAALPVAAPAEATYKKHLLGTQLPLLRQLWQKEHGHRGAGRSEGLQQRHSRAQHADQRRSGQACSVRNMAVLLHARGADNPVPRSVLGAVTGALL